jgi:predicted hydrocarbon binding protein
MHGTIFAELRKYVDARFDPSTWNTLLSEAGLAGHSYEPLQAYPDAEAVALVTTASRLTGKSAGAILEDFGEFIAPDLINMYWSLVPDEWRTLDLIEHTEEVIHKLVRVDNPGAAPPYLSAKRTASDEVVLTYTSARKMCALARGLARGIAKHYRETVEINDDACMLRGDAECRMRIRTIAQ